MIHLLFCLISYCKPYTYIATNLYRYEDGYAELHVRNVNKLVVNLNGRRLEQGRDYWYLRGFSDYGQGLVPSKDIVAEWINPTSILLVKIK